MEDKKKFKVTCAFSQEASRYVDSYGWDALLNNDNLEKGYDYHIIEFDTILEANAYAKGINDANGWSDPIANVQQLKNK